MFTKDKLLKIFIAVLVVGLAATLIVFLLPKKEELKVSASDVTANVNEVFEVEYQVSDPYASIKFDVKTVGVIEKVPGTINKFLARKSGETEVEIVAYTQSDKASFQFSVMVLPIATPPEKEDQTNPGDNTDETDNGEQGGEEDKSEPEKGGDSGKDDEGGSKDEENNDGDNTGDDHDNPTGGETEEGDGQKGDGNEGSEGDSGSSEPSSPTNPENPTNPESPTDPNTPTNPEENPTEPSGGDSGDDVGSGGSDGGEGGNEPQQPGEDRPEEPKDEVKFFIVGFEDNVVVMTEDVIVITINFVGEPPQHFRPLCSEGLSIDKVKGGSGMYKITAPHSGMISIFDGDTLLGVIIVER